MTRWTVALAGFALALLLAAAGRTETALLPEGCRDGITLFCADPSWSTDAVQPAPVRRLHRVRRPEGISAEKRDLVPASLGRERRLRPARGRQQQGDGEAG